MGNDKGKQGAAAPPQPWWLLYFAALIGGAILLADAFHYQPITRVTAKLGIGLLFSAFALLVGNGRTPGFLATALIWMSLIITFLV